MAAVDAINLEDKLRFAKGKSDNLDSKLSKMIDKNKIIVDFRQP